MEMMTKQEKEHLELRLRDLIDNRPAISKRIAEARELGDLKENGDYHAAREEQGIQEAEIRRITTRLQQAQVVDDSHKATGVVFIGATVQIREVGEDEIETVRLVGESSGVNDPNIVEATVSSPFGAALLKARVGDTVSVRGPRGVKQFEIIALV